MDSSAHESEERLELYALGRLPDSEVFKIEEHLFVCEACRGKLDEAGDFAFAIRDDLKAHPQTDRKPFFARLAWPKPRFAFGAAFATAILALGIYWARPGGIVAPVASLHLAAMRGEMQTTGRSRELDLTVTDAPIKGGPFVLEVVDGSGAPVWKGTPDAAPQGLEVKLKDRLSPGDYFVRLYSGAGELLHEYGFRVRG